MMSALNLEKAGFNVDIYDVRQTYNRNIQWAGRQSLIDQLYSITPQLSEQFITKIAKPLDASIHLGIDGTKKISQRQIIKPADKNRIPQTGTEMIAEKSIITMEAKKFEQMLKEYIDTIPNIKQHTGEINLLEKDENDNYKVLNHGTPNLIVIAEGANSKTRNKIGIESEPTSEKKMQIAGIIYIDTNGKMVKHFRKEGDDIKITGTMGTKMSGKTWIVADVDEEKITPAKKFATDNKTLYDRQQKLIRNEFRRLASASLEIPIDKINEAKIEGAIGNGDILPFGFEQKISKQAFSGNNLILAGDSVGNNHWSVGGGMQIGAVSHQERIKQLTKDNDLQKYSQNAIKDTMAWGEVGIVDCYPNLNKHYAKRLYNDSIEKWQKNETDKPINYFKSKF